MWSKLASSLQTSRQLPITNQPTRVSHPLLPNLLHQLLSVTFAEVLILYPAAVLEELGHLSALRRTAPEPLAGL